MMAPGGSETAAGGEAAPAASRREEDLPSSLRSHYAPLAAPPTAHRPLHVLLATTGSVASVKAPSIVKALLAHEHVRVFMVPTKASLHFYNADELESDVKREEQARRGGAKGGTSDSVYTCRHLAAENEAGKDALRNTSSGPLLAPRLKVWHEEHDWSDWDSVGDPVLHIELRRWADVVLVAPCSANTLAKIHAGICDNLLTSLLRALSPSTPTYIFPAMNTLMYLHPLTAQHTAFARNVLGYTVLGPIPKKLACGDVGQGAMSEWTGIVQLVVDRFGLQRPNGP